MTEGAESHTTAGAQAHPTAGAQAHPTEDAPSHSAEPRSRDGQRRRRASRPRLGTFGRLGELERAVMDVLWDRGEPATVRAVADSLHERGLAYTTVMTVLDRLAGKGMVDRERTGRAWSYRPAAAREVYVAQLMLDALELSGSKDAALVRFARAVTGTEADVLRAALAEDAQPVTVNGGEPGGARPAVAEPLAGADERNS